MGDADRTILLFVYGTLRRGFDHPMARRLAFHGRYLGRGRVAARLYRLGRYPGLSLQSRPDTWVKGDLYDLNAASRFVRYLDRYEGIANSRQRLAEYERLCAPIQMEDGTTQYASLYHYRLPVRGARQMISGDFLRQWRRPPEWS